MTEELDLRIPKQEKKKGKSAHRVMPYLMAAVLLGVIVNIAVQFIPPGRHMARTDTSLLPAENQKRLALKFEKQGLDAAAAETWKSYMASARLDDQENAVIWYRIGKLYQKNNNYGEALASYYRSESYAEVESISVEMARRIQECLESMGKYAALRHELSDRVSLKPTSGEGTSGSEGDRVVAEIGSQKMTLSDLDSRIEKQIDRQISLVAPYLTEDHRNKQKEALLKQLSGSQQRQMLANQLVLEEILVRKARELGLMNDPEVRDLLKEQERGLLARRVVEKEFAEKIRILPADLTAYYEAHKNEFMSEGTPKVQKEFDAVKEEVLRAVRSEKENEVRQQLFNELKVHYDVVIHQSVLAGSGAKTR